MKGQTGLDALRSDVNCQSQLSYAKLSFGPPLDLNLKENMLSQKKYMLSLVLNSTPNLETIRAVLRITDCWSVIHLSSRSANTA